MTSGLRNLLLPIICLVIITWAYAPADHVPLPGNRTTVVSGLSSEFIMNMGTDKSNDRREPCSQGNLPPLEQDSEEDNKESEGKEIHGLGENFSLRIQRIYNAYPVNNELLIATEYLSNPTPPPELG